MWGVSVMQGSPSWMVLNLYLLHVGSSSEIIWIPLRATEATPSGRWSVTFSAGALPLQYHLTEIRVLPPCSRLYTHWAFGCTRHLFGHLEAVLKFLGIKKVRLLSYSLRIMPRFLSSTAGFDAPNRTSTPLP